MKKLAIVFFHIGTSPYQCDVLNLAVKRNSKADVFLITDKNEEKFPDGVTVCGLRRYRKQIKDFEGIYQHRNTCPEYFNKRGIMRWVVYNEWWKEHPDYDLFVADSDVMIFSELSDEAENWREFSHTLSMYTAGGQSFWFNMGSMQHLVDIIWNTYRNPTGEGSAEIMGHFDNLQSQGKKGGVCDMTFLKAAAETLNLPVGETTDIVNGSTFDHNILMSEGYEYKDGRKVVNWDNGKPYCKTISGGDMVRFNTLHMSCSGGLVAEYYNKAMEVNCE